MAGPPQGTPWFQGPAMVGGGAQTSKTDLNLCMDYDNSMYFTEELIWENICKIATRFLITHLNFSTTSTYQLAVHCKVVIWLLKLQRFQTLLPPDLQMTLLQLMLRN
jgi:hypothetical protein